MAEPNNSIFNKKAAERLRSPDDLDRYIKVTSPSVWVILLAILALLIGLLAWGFFGTVATGVSATGAYVDGEVVCFIDPSQRSNVNVGNDAYVESTNATVTTISRVPFSRSEASKYLSSDYLSQALMSGDWAYLVVLEGADIPEEKYDMPISVYIITERKAPITLVLG